MKVQVLSMIGAVLVAALYAPATLADSYSSVTTTTQEVQPLTEVRETPMFVQDVPTTTVIREQPVIITQPADREVVVIKQHRHHLIHVGPVRVF
jgi:hypothetical protein